MGETLEKFRTLCNNILVKSNLIDHEEYFSFELANDNMQIIAKYQCKEFEAKI